MVSIVVFVEHQDGQVKRAGLEALGCAHGLGEDVIACLCGEGANALAGGLGAAGAQRAICLSGSSYSPDQIAAELAGVVKDLGATVFLASATSTGSDLAPRVAAQLDSTLYSNCTALEADGERIVATRPWLAGKVIATLRSNAPVFCATLRRNAFAPCETSESAEVTERAMTAVARATLTSITAKEGGKLDVGEAPIVISGGRGLKEPEGFKIIEDLANAFGNAAVGASRAVVDLGWRPHSEQVGQTGKTVSPQLYVAIGISGAIQHLAGMKTAKVIVAINKDADAPIFKVADYGIVGDAREVVPLLAAEVRKIKAQG